jgi:hypothetical protein
MHVVYFSHSYRDTDAAIVDHFGRLLRSEGIVPSLDPPSKTGVNAAKLERQLAGCDGMVAILCEREGGISQNILFEIGMCLRAQKPILVFVEDTLANTVIPAGLLQHRFSRKSFFRELREHREALRTLTQFLGTQPRYQVGTMRRTCLIVGFDQVDEVIRREMSAFMDARKYEALFVDEMRSDLVLFDAIGRALSPFGMLTKRYRSPTKSPASPELRACLKSR